MEEIENYLHKWGVNEQCEPKKLYTCDKCGEDICDGEEYYNFYGDIMCEDCAKEWFDSCKRMANADELQEVEDD